MQNNEEIRKSFQTMSNHLSCFAIQEMQILTTYLSNFNELRQNDNTFNHIFLNDHFVQATLAGFDTEPSRSVISKIDYFAEQYSNYSNKRRHRISAALG